MRGESMKGKSKKSTYSTTFGVDPFGVDPSKPANALFMGQRSPPSVCLSGLESGAQGGTRTLMP